MNETNLHKIRRSIALAVEKKPGADAAEIANFIVRSELKLVIEFARERIALLVREEMRTQEPLPSAGPYQMFLEGFGSLAQRVPLPGRGKTLAKATIVDLRLSLKTARTKGHEQTQRIAALIREMEPYAKTRRDLTVERYCELRAAGVEAHVSTSARA